MAETESLPEGRGNELVTFALNDTARSGSDGGCL